MGKCKTKAIQTDLGTFRHNQASRNYSGIFRYIQNPVLTQINLKLWYIQRTLTYSEPEAYSEPRHIHNPGIFRTPVYSER